MREPPLPSPLPDKEVLPLPHDDWDASACEGVRVSPPAEEAEADAEPASGDALPPGARAVEVMDMPRGVFVVLGVAQGDAEPPLAENVGARGVPEPDGEGEEEGAEVPLDRGVGDDVPVVVGMGGEPETEK